MILLFISITCLVLFGTCQYMLFRNNWVYQVRTELLQTDYEKYKTLPSYEHMLNKWWVWDINKFLPYYFRDEE